MAKRQKKPSVHQRMTVQNVVHTDSRRVRSLEKEGHVTPAAMRMSLEDAR